MVSPESAQRDWKDLGLGKKNAAANWFYDNFHRKLVRGSELTKVGGINADWVRIFDFVANRNRAQINQLYTLADVRQIPAGQIWQLCIHFPRSKKGRQHFRMVRDITKPNVFWVEATGKGVGAYVYKTFGRQTVRCVGPPQP